ncbi:integrin alpha-PS1 isoform X1 [Cimex lectularius]|uniref:Integrin alpha-PS1 n=1 Tax=Cimex lectularius TaxID=79782 RepID=A0A8I6TBY6_CIMLE|nr:integrin alpha-PS1 isoform X1 [Cimex lectularius]XP_024080646.1 integrin alpha-PS1 isoform X1 [Cimex lectularius]
MTALELVLALVTLLARESHCFNFETRLPVIKEGRAGSYFGFSVALHEISDRLPQSQQLSNSRLLVGAPLDKNLQPQTNRSGALWQCPLTNKQNDCSQVYTDGIIEEGESFDYDVDDLHPVPPSEFEIKEGQWLGVTVRSLGKGKKVMVCAHRYITKYDGLRHGKGHCYTLYSDLTIEVLVNPCKGRPTEREHEQYAYCQVGTSLMLINDTAIFGSPGPYTWRGTVFVSSIADSFLYRDKTIYYTPHFEDNSPVDKYSYLGMAVTAGDYFGEGIAYAAGAPRSNGTGQVVIFSRKNAVISMTTRMILSGEIITSNFGYELCTADVNGDRLPDLIVGAPNYFDKHHGGAIYIYINHQNDCSLQCEEPIKITGQHESRFGISITNLGDINKDGCDDIAVGAPYENDGVVYIFLGSPNGTLPEPSQVISGSDYKSKSFGYSLNGGVDVDHNDYPDLLIGAFESSQVILLRTRPIIEITTMLKSESAIRNIDPTSKYCADYPDINLACFKFHACVSIHGLGKGKISSIDSKLELNYVLQGDVTNRFPRVFIGNDLKSKPHKKNEIIALSRHNLTYYSTCHEDIVFLKEDTKDIQSPISLRLSYSLIQKEPPVYNEDASFQSMSNYPILNKQQSDKIFQATFLKDCGDNDICESQLQIDSALLLPKSKLGGTWDLPLGEYKEVVVNTTVHNLKESAYEAFLIVNHSPSLSYVAQQGGTASCTRVNETEVVCALGNPLESNAMVNIILRFEPLSIIDEMSQVEFNLYANTTSKLEDSQGTVKLMAVIVRKAELTLKGSTRQQEVLYHGTVRGESEMEYKDQTGMRIRHTYEVVNNGPSHVNNVEIHVEWPFQVANNKPRGKWLLYMDEEPTIEAEEGGVCYTTPEQVNPLKLKDRNTLQTRQRRNHTEKFRYKRDIEMVVKKDPDNVVRMNCRNKTAFCYRFHCIVYKLLAKQSAVVTVMSRLWNSTLVEDYPNVKSVEIASFAKLYVKQHGITITSKSTDTEAQIVTVAIGHSLKQQGSDVIEWWMILVGVVTGILLLLLFVLCLCKCGFFKRSRPNNKISGKVIEQKERLTSDDNMDY